jgi:hypothetical protein
MTVAMSMTAHHGARRVWSRKNPQCLQSHLDEPLLCRLAVNVEINPQTSHFKSKLCPMVAENRINKG